MHVLTTLAAFILLTAAMILLRTRWPSLSERVRRRITIAAIAVLALTTFSSISGYVTASHTLNDLVLWAVLVAYLLFLMRFSLIRPRWFTVPIAIILLLPILSTSIFLRFAETISGFPRAVTSLGDHVFSETTTWHTDPSEASGIDFSIYAVPPHLPFIRRHRAALRFYNRQCDAAHASAQLSPDHARVLYTCPALPGNDDLPTHTQQPLD